MIRHDLARQPPAYCFPLEVLSSIPPATYDSIRVLADDFGTSSNEIRNAIKRLKPRFDLVVTQRTVAIAPGGKRDVNHAAEMYWRESWDVNLK